LIESNIRGNRAQSGGAIHVSDSAVMRIEQSRITANTAEVSGGAIQVKPAQATASTSQMRLDRCQYSLGQHNLRQIACPDTLNAD
jgi:hypothetical protein